LLNISNLIQVPGLQKWSRDVLQTVFQGELKIPGWCEHPILPLTFHAYGYHVLLQFVYITIECVGVTVEAQAQKFIISENNYVKVWGKSPSAGGRKGVGIDPKVQQFFVFKNNAFTACFGLK